MADQLDLTHKTVRRTNGKPSDVFSVESKEIKAPQAVTASPTLKVTSYVKPDDELSYIFTEFHMTIETRVSELTDKQASMLLSVASYKAVHEGIDVSLYMSMEFLYNFLWKNGRDPLETQNDKIRKTLLVSDIVLSYIRGSWLNLIEREKLPETVVDEIETLQWLPTERTLNSWHQHWQLERYLKIKIVPVESLINRNKYSTYERYSGYTKGYGNDGSPARVKRTKPTPELDGDSTDRTPPQLSLQEFEQYQTALRLIETARAHRIQSKR